jgi:serine/threonine protein phosphatase PrpC
MDALPMAPDSNLERIERRRAYSPVLQVDDFRPLSSTVRVEFGAHSNGRPREVPNEDHYLVIQFGRSQETLVTSLAAADVPQRFLEHGYAMLVADGMGDTGAGGLASRIAVTTLVHLALHYGRWNLRVDARTAFEIVERLDWCYGQIDEVVKQRARTNRHLAGMATKLTAAYSAGDELFVAHVGRSPAYIFREGRLVHLAGDRSSPPSPVKGRRPRLVTDESRELSAILNDTIGGSGKLTVTVEQYQLRDGDVLLLCTEGLTASLSDDQIADVLADRRSPADLSRTLVEAALYGRPVAQIAHVTALLAQYRIPSRLS